MSSLSDRLILELDSVRYSYEKNKAFINDLSFKVGGGSSSGFSAQTVRVSQRS